MILKFDLKIRCLPNFKKLITHAFQISPSIRRLLPIFESIPHYMKTRINRLWKKWKEGAHEVMQKYPKSMIERRKLNVRDLKFLVCFKEMPIFFVKLISFLVVLI